VLYTCSSTTTAVWRGVCIVCVTFHYFITCQQLKFLNVPVVVHDTIAVQENNRRDPVLLLYTIIFGYRSIGITRSFAVSGVLRNRSRRVFNWPSSWTKRSRTIRGKRRSSRVRPRNKSLPPPPPSHCPKLYSEPRVQFGGHKKKITWIMKRFYN